MKAKTHPGNSIDLLNSGAEYFPALIEALESARIEIHFEAYIYADDPIAERVTAALCAAARRGVRVRMVVDGFGARDMPMRFRLALAESGVGLLVYRKPLWWQPVRGLRRMHRKLAAIDNQIAFVGGINVVDDWNTPHEVPPRYDYAVRIAGPLVGDIAAAARHLWTVVSYTSLKRHQWHAPPPPPGPAGNVRARLLVRDNLAHRRDIEKAYLAAIRHARSEVLLAMAYFLPSRRVFNALRNAARRGTRVRILLQGPSDHVLLKYATQSLYRRLIDAHIEVYEYHQSFLHTKVAVVDEAWATVGSSNLDPFSLFLSREANVEIFDAGFARILGHSVDQAITQGAERMTLATLTRMRWYSRALQWATFRFARSVVTWLNLPR